MEKENHDEAGMTMAERLQSILIDDIDAVATEIRNRHIHSTDTSVFDMEDEAVVEHGISEGIDASQAYDEDFGFLGLWAQIKTDADNAAWLSRAPDVPENLKADLKYKADLLHRVFDSLELH